MWEEAFRHLRHRPRWQRCLLDPLRNYVERGSFTRTNRPPKVRVDQPFDKERQASRLELGGGGGIVG